MALCPHKARLLVGIEIWPLAGRGLQGECMYVLRGCGLESPVWALRDLNSESGTRHKKGTWREMGAEGCGGYLCKGGWFSLALPFLSDCHLDNTPNQLTPQDTQLCLVDAGYFINNSCPSMFRSGRQVDLILSFGYSQFSPFEVPSPSVGTPLCGPHG